MARFRPGVPTARGEFQCVIKVVPGEQPTVNAQCSPIPFLTLKVT
jgi:hypothetical protein